MSDGGAIDHVRTRRLLLRAVTLDDLDVIAGMQQDPAVMAHYGNGRPLTAAQAEETVVRYHVTCRSHDYWAWTVTDSDSAEVLGQATAGWSELDGQRAIELGYIFKRSAWGQGYGPEAVAAVVQHGPEQLGWPRVFAGVGAANRRSIRLCEKAGLKFLRVEPGRHGGVRWLFVSGDG